MFVNEIFTSIEGEGIRMGYPVTFIRLYGCNLNCSYCDTRYSCEGQDGTEMSVSEVIEKAKEAGVERITLTGGEPLIHKNVEELVDGLVNEGFEVNIETNGSVDIYPYIKENVIITMDYKSISSGMTDKMNHKNLKYLRNQDVLKFVVEDKKDLDDMKRIIETYSPSCSIFVSPVFGKIELPDMVDYIKDNKLNECRVQVQLHKIIWEPTKRGV
ncbi:MAG: putative 7-carboxy-7-deazaguanine synthase QueE [Candidatus Izemoplasmatales bacterium]|nr:putative 7-carboxy-7-deazaguanine synthase QueE [Candidatus Izemoplasmatales bacterium]